jgi:hypothetical protein
MPPIVRCTALVIVTAALEPRHDNGSQNETRLQCGAPMRRAAAIVVTVGFGLAVAYVAHERTIRVSSRRAEAAPPSTGTPGPSRSASNPSTTRPDRTPLVVEGRGSADASSPTSMTPIRGTDDRPEPQIEVLGEHDDDFMNRYLEIAARFRSEPRDPTSAVSLEREILDRFSALTGLAVTTLDITCKTTTCRVRMVEQPGVEFQPLQGPGGFQNIVDGFGTVVSTLSESNDGATTFEWLLARDSPGK